MKKASELGLETIQLEDQVLLVQSSKECKIQNGDYILGGIDDESYHELWVMDNHFVSEEDYKVIASTKPLEGLPLLVIEDEVQKMADERFPEDGMHNNRMWQAMGFVKGYNKAKETYKFTEEDLRKAYDVGRGDGYEVGSKETYLDSNELDLLDKEQNEDYSSFVKNLTKKELWIEVEEKHFRTVKNEQGQFIDHELILEPKITEGKIKGIWK